jgi:hypothetical protein
MVTQKSCFVIAPVGAARSDTRMHSGKVFEHLIKPAAIKCGYTVLRASNLTQSGIFTTALIQHILSDPLVIADLTGGNPNVFYELGLRHAVGKPVVQIVAQGQHIPFDVVGTRTILFDIDDEESRSRAMVEIVNQIRSLERASSFETPISAAGANAWTPFPKSKKMLRLPSADQDYLERYLDRLEGQGRIEFSHFVKDIKRSLEMNPQPKLFGTPIENLDAALTIVNNAPPGGYLSGTSSLQGNDADEQSSYRSAVNLALERNVAYCKVICSSSDITPDRYHKWKEELTDKVELIRSQKIKPNAFRFLHYPSPISVDVLISQEPNGECREMMAGFAVGSGRGGFHSTDEKMVYNWMNLYLQKKIISEAEQHIKSVLDGSEECDCREFLVLLDDAWKTVGEPKRKPLKRRAKRT